MKIIYSIGAKFAGGGIGTIAYYSARGLYQRGLLHRLLCGTFRPTEISTTKIRSVGLASQLLRKLATFDTSQRLWYLESILFDHWACRKLEPADLFYVWSNYGLRSIEQARKMGMTIVVHHASSHPSHQTRLLQEEWQRWGLAYRTFQPALQRSIAELSTADYVVVPSTFVHDSFLAEGFSEDRILQIPFGVNIDQFQPAKERTHPYFRVLFLGQISIRKGVPYLLEAWRQLGWRDAELWLVGRFDPEFRGIFSRWRELDGLKIIDYVPDPVGLFQQADIFVFPTIEEGSALVTYEAMACGLPILTTPNAGSVAQDGVEGFIVPIRDVDALVERLETLRTNQELRQTMSQLARQRAEQYTWEKSGQLLIDHLFALVQDVEERGVNHG